MTDPLPPEATIRLDPANLRGIAHPIRVQALGWLRRHGPATATQLAQHLGQSSGSTSYHLRQLAQYGFIIEDTERGNARERWWRAAHRSTQYDSETITSTMPNGADDETRAAGAEYMRAIGRVYAHKIERFTDSIETIADDYGPDWPGATTLSDWPLYLTAGQTRELVGDIVRLAERFRAEGASEQIGARPVTFQVQVFPAPES